ncbi:LRR receptor-like serine/threonine-protein kinase IOS1 [Glycine soja]
MSTSCRSDSSSGSISIACGAPAGVNFTVPNTGLNYTSDANFINTGVSRTIVPELRDQFKKYLWDLRSFPKGKRNCYKINITRGSKYLIRAHFLYGNYDGLNMLPQFDLLLGANRWDTVNIKNASVGRYFEIIYVPSLDYVHICMVDTGLGTPFISAIELRTLRNDIYETRFGSLETYFRVDLGSNKRYRYNYDVYDRYWSDVDLDTWRPLNFPIDADSLVQNKYQPPAVVMSTAITPANVSAPSVISWKPDDPKDSFYVYMHFTEIQVLAKNQTREFNITLNGNPWHENMSPRYHIADTIYSTSGISGEKIIFSFVMTETSTLPPIINAIEIYRVKEFPQQDTYQGDVDAITTIKSVYGVTRDWQGDPCCPKDYLWEGLNCTYPVIDSPRIITLNLSSSGLSGKIDPSILNLTMLEKLDLSNNSLNGEVPDFLSQLQYLKIFVSQNPYLCESGQCNFEKKQKNIVTPIVASISGALILLVAVAILWTLKRRKSKALMEVNDESEISRLQSTKKDDSLLQVKKQIYSYSDVLKITNNFNTIIGKGGFGTVYLGYIDDSPVAVKVLSPSSVNGFQQFQAEVKLLIKVHHKNLTSLIGYCNEGTNKALIYEYMANGNLQEHLSGKHSKSTFLSWEDRLRIAVDAALGLEYLQNGCKPPIIHRDVKSTNILLNEHFQAKLSDFGLSKAIPTDGESLVSTVLAGTPGTRQKVIRNGNVQEFPSCFSRMSTSCRSDSSTGSISIACGAPAGVNFTVPKTGLNYTSDANFINTGVSRTIVPELRDQFQRYVWNLRSFPEGKRNCYKINITRGSKYLIGASFLYGNYDGLNMLPQFDLLLGANRWDTVKIENASVGRYFEIIYVPSLDYVHICMVDTGLGTPFISAIELRSLRNDIYETRFGSLEKYTRRDLGSNEVYRYHYDVYDRFWSNDDVDAWYDNVDKWKQLNFPIDADSLVQNEYQPPAVVMSTAVTPANVSAPLVISWKPYDPKESFYVYMHFTEIQVLAKNQTRQFNITLNGKLWYENESPRYHSVFTRYTPKGISGKLINFSFVMTETSTLPPIINAIEIYRVKEFPQPDTYQGDVDAITTIKSVYGVTRDWQGDPCCPKDYLWEGLNCTYPVVDSPRIITLDLSNNSLNGEVPDFLSQLQYLKILNLENNNLSGSIPSTLVEKSKEGSLSLSVGQNPYLCESGQCNFEKKQKNIVTAPIVASISGVLILLVAVAILWTLKRRKSKALMVEKDQHEVSLQYIEQDDSLLQFRKQIYSYSDVLKITNNFNTVVGKGGFGTVYLGHINDTPVAVKMLSRSSAHGYQQFQAEVKLLMTVHHRNLTSLAGYCNEGTNKGLIYEYMANGNLNEHLSGKHSKTKFLTWEDRLRIAVDAALGLEYLHNGCKPPIIHRDIKSTNILLNEHFHAKLSDFGLSKIMPTDGVTHVSTVIAGTPGYLDPDYCISNRVTEKSDVYSFGIVLLEIITRQPVIARSQENIHISEWVSSLIAKEDIKAIVDSRLGGDFDSNSARKVIKLAMACISPKPNERPMMKIVVTELMETLSTELARTKYIDANLTRDSAEPVNTNMDIELTMPRMSRSFLVAFLGFLVLAVLIQAQDQSGFISIACGAPAGVNFTVRQTGLNYTSDANFINTGVSRTIVPELRHEFLRNVWNLRSFPEGKRNCYKINITRGSKYLIGASFLYGNYDGLNMLPKFDLLLGANRWDTVDIKNASVSRHFEIIYVPSLDYVHICMVDTGLGTPFISAITLRSLRNDIYETEFGSLQTYIRRDLGSNKGYRYDDDVYDRYWSYDDADTWYDNVDKWKQLNFPIDADSLVQNHYQPPAVVMSTAVTPANVSAPLVISWKPYDPKESFYVYMHFTEIQVLAKNQTRQFNITLNGKLWYENESPRYHSVNTIYSTSGISGKLINFSFVMTETSTLPPIINAIEIYRVKEFPQQDTYQGDVDAITTIKSVYGVTRDWQGDPCSPKDYLWEGLNCTYPVIDSPRIITLNLSSSGLSGKIGPSILNLTMLEKLDLSNNSLNGEVPDFLSQLQYLKILNLENNNLSGSIPSTLVEKSKEGSLSLSVGQNPYLCESGQCNFEKKQKNIVTAPIVASISGVLILLVAVAILWTLKRRKSKEKSTALMEVNDESEISRLRSTKKDDSLAQVKKQIYSYSDVLKITNNFNTIIGKGGFGTVYLGYIDDSPVAVKVLSPSSVNGFRQFQAEVKLLVRVHHKNLTSLIGYCNEGTNKALIYEYMANGNLQEHLSGKHSKSTFLSWEDRLRIAVDAALGLEYLQNGCKPPIIHRDVKSTNILLNEHFQAKLSDFGLSKAIPTDGESHVSTVVAGFISIACGAPAGVNFTVPNTGLNYTSDANFINTGVSRTIVPELRDQFPRYVWNLRSFPEGKRNCYKINITRGSKYLIGASFLYGNYDGLNMLPQFDLLLGANRWDTVKIKNASVGRYFEIIYVPSLDYVHICMVDTGLGTPFISAIELRSLRNDIYETRFGSLQTYIRRDLGSNKDYRYDDDVYDRYWSYDDADTWYDNVDKWKQLNFPIDADSLVQNHYQPPAVVMSTAVTPANVSAPLVISWMPYDPEESFYVYMHFTEIQVLAKNQTRQFNITLNGKLWYENESPRYHSVFTIYTPSGISGKLINFSFVMTETSTLPPIINAIEIYRVKEFPQPDTYQGDVDAITTIKSVYGVTRDWQGDPCCPKDYLWEGLNCTYPVIDSPRIITLNLSSSGLSGKIDPSILNLTMLEKLDLSNNSLNGEVPDFLSQLQHLKILNLENNNLSGSIPSTLVQKSKEGSLSLSVGQNPHLCESGQCNEKEKGKGEDKKNTVTPVVASVGGVVIILVAVAAILWTLKRRNSKASMVEKDQSPISPQYTEQEQDDSLLQSKKQIYSYSDVLNITNNFNTIVGKGGFGTVYLGYIDDTPVAVKMLSPSSVHGYQQFQAEVKLLMRVHHKSLTSLVGYCNEGNNKALIYEYMHNGNLQEHITGKRSKTKFFTWEDRLRIAVDAASGLEYLQNGCKPPIIHRDVKSTNILLNEHFQAKLSDFGLSKIIPTDGSTHVSTVIAGTPGYLDPEYYITNRLTEKSDVYSFVTIYNASLDQFNEIIHVPSLDSVQLCLVNTGHGTPFISAVELRTLKNDTYVTRFGSLETYNRWDLGSNQAYRYNYDVYDRAWFTYGSNNDWTQLNVSISVDSLSQSDFKPPAIVMSTAVTPVNASAPLVISWEPQDQTELYYVYMHFTEVEVLEKNQTREFNINQNGKPWYQNLSPRYQKADTIYSGIGTSGEKIKYSLEMTENSNLPPIINAIEIYRLKDFQQSDTYQGDVDVITTIKSVYKVTRDWQGDPCGPVAYLWHGLNCTYAANQSPRITTLNLSSSGLLGKIDPSISKLAMLEKLDLSNNSLNGEVPDFLSQLQHLKILNLEKNNLSGSIPSTLVEKSKEGSLSLSVGQNSFLCESDQCNEKQKEKKKNNIVTPLVASVSGVVILLVVMAAILWTLKRRKSKASMVEKDQSQISPQYTEQDDSLLQFKKQIYSFSDVLKITNNFNTTLGKGGFGTVYLGHINDTPVAVKMLSPSSVHGYQQFQAEVKLLMRVHHKNLTSLVGYCNEGTSKGLIYEYMANGNLLEHLSGKHGKTKFFTWEERLRIAVDAALGLEYLQNGCKPPIIHRDVKSTNILLNEHFQAKLSDFGLSKVIPTEGVTHVSTVVAGTPGYLDPEYFITNRLTEKSDVYSFGVVLLEIITSQPVIARNQENIHISEWVSSLIMKGDIKAIVDSRLEGAYDTNSVWKAVEIATACVSPNLNKRPITSVIVVELKESLAMELARTKNRGTNTRDSVTSVTMNLNTEFIPQAR